MHFYTKFTKNRCFVMQKQLKALIHDGDFINYLDILNIFRIFAEKINLRFLNSYGETSPFKNSAF